MRKKLLEIVEVTVQNVVTKTLSLTNFTYNVKNACFLTIPLPCSIQNCKLLSLLREKSVYTCPILTSFFNNV